MYLLESEVVIVTTSMMLCNRRFILWYCWESPVCVGDICSFMYKDQTKNTIPTLRVLAILCCQGSSCACFMNKESRMMPYGEVNTISITRKVHKMAKPFRGIQISGTQPYALVTVQFNDIPLFPFHLQNNKR